MRVRILLYCLTALLIVWAAQPVPEQPAPAPDLSRVVRVFTRNGIGHSCPVSANLAVTNAHVVVDEEKAPSGGRYQSLRGAEGTFSTISVSPVSDLAITLTSRADSPLAYYPLAKDPPRAGERLWWVAYNWDKAKAFEMQVLSGTVRQVIAGHILIDAKTPEGSSGGCVLNQRGEVVGVTTFDMELGPDGNVAGAVGLWGKWFDLPVLLKAVEGARAK